MMTIKETATFLNERDNYLVITHRRPDGDAHGSAAALVMALRQLGKTAYILKNPETTDRYLKYVQDFWQPEGYVPDTVVTVDLAAPGLFPINIGEYADQVILSIDHHPSNTGYAKFTCVNGTRASCGEVLYDIFSVMDIEIDLTMAASLYIALSTDTGCFSFANTTGNTFRVAGALADTGLEFIEINRELFRTKSRGRFVLEGLIMSNIEFYHNGKTAIITITKDMMDSTGCTENDMDDIAAMPGSIEGVVCGITLRELTGATDCKASVRTSPDVDANVLCSALGGGGHKMAAGASPANMTVIQLKEALVASLDKTFSEGKLS